MHAGIPSANVDSECTSVRQAGRSCSSDYVPWALDRNFVLRLGYYL